MSFKTEDGYEVQFEPELGQISIPVPGSDVHKMYFTKEDLEGIGRLFDEDEINEFERRENYD